MGEYCNVCGCELTEQNKYMNNMCWDCKYGGYENDFIKNYVAEVEYLKQERDWTGNSKSTFVTLGASNHVEHDRAENDFYSTDPKALRIFLDKIEKDGDIKLAKHIWECACGNGALSKVLLANNYEVFSSDLIDRGFGFSGLDFLESQHLPDETEYYDWDILTNPPYKYAKQFVEKALELVEDGRYVIMFLKIQFLEGKERRKLFEKYPPKFIYVNSERQLCYLNGDDSRKMSSATCYCWYIWEKGFNGDPIIRWI